MKIAQNSSLLHAHYGLAYYVGYHSTEFSEAIGFGLELSGGVNIGLSPFTPGLFISSVWFYGF